jgi:hypothetical protein
MGRAPPAKVAQFGVTYCGRIDEPRRVGIDANNGKECE